MSCPRWKKGKDGKDFAALAAANPMSSLVVELQASLGCSKLVATLSGRGGDTILGVKPGQAVLLNRAAFGRAVENAGAEKQWFQLGPEEVFYLSHALKCFTVESENKKQMTGREPWDHLSSTSESFPEMYKAYSHLRSKNWVVRSGLQYGADFVAYRHHPALVHSEFAVVLVPEGKEFGHRCGRLKVWSDLLCALRASGSVAKKLLVLTINSSSCELSSPDCLEQLIVHERTITRWIPQQCREQRRERCREEANMEEQDHKRESVVFNHCTRCSLKMAGFRGLAPKTKNLVVAGGLSAFVLGVYYYTMRAVGGTDELQVAIDKFEGMKKKDAGSSSTAGS